MSILRDVEKWRNRNTSHLMSVIEHRVQKLTSDQQQFITHIYLIQNIHMHFQNIQKQCFQNFQKHSSSEKTFFIQPKCKNVRKNRRDVVKWRNRNTSHLISAIEHRKRAFKTNPEMLFTKRIPIQCFGSLQTQTLDSNKKNI